MRQANFWGELIRALREEQGVTQRTLAARAKVNRSTLRRIETGGTSGDIETMEKLLHYLGYELEALSAAGVEERIRRQQIEEENPERRAILAASRVLSMGLKLTVTL
jgi:transcriptional regulator with XRE-family HTH domain